jgi:hypothetical protein
MKCAPVNIQFVCYDRQDGVRGLAIIPKASLKVGGGAGVKVVILSAGIDVTVNLNYNFKR